MRWWMIVLSLFVCCKALGLQKQDVDFADDMKIGEKKLLLNGVCLRKVRRLGMHFEVYVGGLYVQKKSADADVLLSQPGPKFLPVAKILALSHFSLQTRYILSVSTKIRPLVRQLL